MARLELTPRQHVVGLEQRHCVIGNQVRKGVGRGPEVEQAAALRLGMPLLVVVVAAEHDPLVLRVAALEDGTERVLEHGVAHRVAHRGSVLDRRLELVGQLVDGLGHDRVQHGVGQRGRLARAERPELELVAGEGERAGPVPIAAVLGQLRQHGGA